MDWIELHRRLTAKTLELHELDDVEFAKLKALLPKRPRRRTIQELKRGPAADTDEDRAYEWMRALLKFNEERRQQKAAQPQQPDPAPKNVASAPESPEEALAMGYVAAIDVLKIFAEQFKDDAGLRRYLKDNDHIRAYWPTPNRKMVHAGDLLRQLARDAHRSFEGLDRDGVQDRIRELEKKRKEARK